MAFVNIDLSDHKLEQYDFSLLEKVSRTKSPHSSITIDAERDIWLRKVYTLRLGDPREDIGTYAGDYWGFYWKGTFFALETFKSNTQGMGIGNHLSYHAKVRVLTTPEILGDKTLEHFQKGRVLTTLEMLGHKVLERDYDEEAEKAALLPFPKALEDKKLEILKDLKAALEAYAGGGIFSKSSGCTVELEFQGVTL